MCKYCELKESSYKSGTRRGYYTLSHELLIKNSNLIVRTNVKEFEKLSHQSVRNILLKFNKIKNE